MEINLEVAFIPCPPEHEEAWLEAARLLLCWMEEEASDERRDQGGLITALEAAEQAKLGDSPAVRTGPAVDERRIAPRERGCVIF